jgi:hypothetical protein
MNDEDETPTEKNIPVATVVLSRDEFLIALPEIISDTGAIAEAYADLAAQATAHDPDLAAKATAIQTSCSDLVKYLSSRVEDRPEEC